MTRVLVAGETLVDLLPRRPAPDEQDVCYGRRAGGAPANVAVALARLGHPPDFWTKLGGDPLAAFLERTLESEGLPATFVERDLDAKTTLALVSHDDAGDRSFTFYRDAPAETRLEPGGVPDATLRERDWVYVGGVLLASEPSRTALLDLAERARACGCRVVFDPNVRPELTDDEFEAAFESALAHADVVAASPEDLRAVGLTGDAGGLADGLLDRGVDTALVTLGEDGALGVATEAAPWGPARVRHSGYDVDTVDTTGAGDAFAGAVVAGLLEGEGLAEALAFANAVAALATTGDGGMAALPDEEAVRRFVSER